VTIIPVASVSVSPASASVSVGQTVQFVATPKDANGNALTGRTVTWGSSNSSVATVSGGGLASGVATGSATITATSGGRSGSAGALHLAIGKTPDPYIRPVDGGTASYRDIYWRMYVQNQAGWVGGGGYKLSRAQILATPQWGQAMVAPVWGGDTPQTQNNLLLDPTSGTDAAGNLLATVYGDFAH